MTEPSPPTIDRTEWGAGPWDDEPDRVDFVHAGFACLLHRGPLGHWCGYVGVPREHPAYGQSYDAADVDVHGGLTYANRCAGAICHVPAPGMPDDVWWLGFDCGHAGDYTPSMGRWWGTGYPFPDAKYDHDVAMAAVEDWTIEKYRTVAYVRAETERLATQLAHA
jgi:hypothetical protein